MAKKRKTRAKQAGSPEPRITGNPAAVWLVASFERLFGFTSIILPPGMVQTTPLDSRKRVIAIDLVLVPLLVSALLIWRMGASNPFAWAIAAVLILPCWWLAWEVGKVKIGK